eukprot:GSA120T00004753001.1
MSMMVASLSSFRCGSPYGAFVSAPSTRYFGGYAACRHVKARGKMPGMPYSLSESHATDVSSLVDANPIRDTGLAGKETHMINRQGFDHFCRAVLAEDAKFEFYNLPFRWPATVLYRYGTSEDLWLPLVVKTSVRQSRYRESVGEAEFRFRLRAQHAHRFPLVCVAPTIGTFFTENFPGGASRWIYGKMRSRRRLNMLFRQSAGLCSGSLAEVLQKHWLAASPLGLHDCFLDVLSGPALENTSDFAIARALISADRLLYRRSGVRLSFPPPDPRKIACNSHLDGLNVLHKLASSPPEYQNKRKRVKLSTANYAHGETQERPLTQEEALGLDVICVMDVCVATQELLGVFVFPREEMKECFSSAQNTGAQSFMVYPPYVIPRLNCPDKVSKARRQAEFYIDVSCHDAPEKLLSILHRRQEVKQKLVPELQSVEQLQS